MIKVVFTYKTHKDNLNELMEKFAESASNPKFISDVTNKKIDMFKREDGNNVYIVLDIYYDSINDYNARTEFERGLDEWNNIWFSTENKHEEISVEVFDIL